MTLSIYNTLSRKKETFTPMKPGKVSMYVCGVTVYDYCHVGHARCYVAFDVIHRWLRKTHEVTYVRNFTDVDDKIIARANELGEDPHDLSTRFIHAFHEDMAKLGVGKADVEPRVTEHMDDIIAFVEGLEEKGFAYRVDSDSGVEGAGSDVYFRVSKFDSYTELSGRNLDDLKSGARVEVDTRKESPIDFALWKSAKKGEPFWRSPFGKGRPGWHIECSVMSKCHLGETFDIHGGGKDLVFPHHTNEIAQSEALHDGARFANLWMHNGFVNIDSEKMSKSLGNFFTIRDVLGRFTGEALRYFLLTTHYRGPINFSDAQLEEAEGRVFYLYETLENMAAYLEANEAAGEGEDLAEAFAHDAAPFSPWLDFEKAMDDDFNTARGLAALADMLKVANLLMAGREKETLGRKLKMPQRARLLAQLSQHLEPMMAILGVGEKNPADFLADQRNLRCQTSGIDVAAVEALVKDRDAARAEKDWEKSDALRDELQQMGISIRDTSDGGIWSVESLKAAAGE
jgi:cysteinyl-tRNA synthetase